MASYILVLDSRFSTYWTLSDDDGKLVFFESYKEAKKVGENLIKNKETNTYDVFKSR
ncbi:hypothetical protein FHS04_002827 [Mesoflavibacter sabulilitoris]|uniref:hypothetical protein n=1 Tax=Mesoflavibacter zeaxanthinifaciens TaxID=393060 RepID=UPI0015E7C003|nr:hypothetical protein [Mesoflavibacter zeaxanthinifaciens]MBB3125283.1 hypothetical protein [Mesoflavibacter zeaxanthinifaciens subsp. sabulilitoris]